MRALLLSLCLAVPAAAEPARVIKVVDGDTIHAHLRGADTKVRVLDLDTPEIGHNARCEAERQAGERASAFAKELMPPGKLVDVRVAARLDRYGRALGAITIDGRDYATAVIAAGLGMRYRGGRRRDWCEVTR